MATKYYGLNPAENLTSDLSEAELYPATGVPQELCGAEGEYRAFSLVWSDETAHVGTMTMLQDDSGNALQDSSGNALVTWEAS